MAEKLEKNQSVCFPFDFFHSSINDCEKKYQMTFNEALLLFQSSSNLSGLIVTLWYHKGNLKFKIELHEII